jgi:hypothetical protein
MKRFHRFLEIFTLIGLIGLISCKSGHLSKQKLITLIDHSQWLHQDRKVNGIDVGIKFYPYQLLVLQELQNTNAEDTSLIASLEQKYRGQYYFRLSFSKDGKEVIRQLGSYQRYSDMLQVFSFELGKYINASTDKADNLPLLDYAFEQQYGTSRANNAVIAFKTSDFASADEIRINIGEFGLGTGNMQFIFKKSEIDKVPPISYHPTL